MFYLNCQNGSLNSLPKEKAEFEEKSKKTQQTLLAHKKQLMQALTGETFAHSLIPQVAQGQVGAFEDWLGFGGVNCLRRLFRGGKGNLAP